MTLDREWSFRADLMAKESAAIANHNLEWVDCDGGQSEELCHSSLHKVMGTPVIYQYGDLGRVEGSVNSKGCGGRQAR